MKLRNTTHWKNYYLRRMVSWVCKQLDYSVSKVNTAKFGKRREGPFNGCAWYHSREIRVVIGPESAFPVEPYVYPGRKSDVFMSPRYNDQLEALIGVTAHEITHLITQNGSERKTRFNERRCVELFRNNREELEQMWAVAPARAAKKSQAEKNEENARKLLKKWQRKYKLAETKVKQYTRKCKYYDRK